MLGFSPNFKIFVESMERPIGDGIRPAVAPVAHPSVFGAPPPVVGPGVQPKKYVGRKKPGLGGVDVHPGRRWSDAAITNILDLYEGEWMHCNMGLLVARHWTRTRIEHRRQMPAELRRVDIHIKYKIEKLKVEYRRQKTLPEEQTSGSGSTWV